MSLATWSWCQENIFNGSAFERIFTEVDGDISARETFSFLVQLTWLQNDRGYIFYDCIFISV